RLFGAACCRDLPGLLTYPNARLGIEAAELRADGCISRQVLRTRRRRLRNPRSCLKTPWAEGFWAVRELCRDVVRPDFVAMFASMAGSHWSSWKWRARYRAGSQPNLVRDIFGNPFRPVALDP